MDLKNMRDMTDEKNKKKAKMTMGLAGGFATLLLVGWVFLGMPGCAG